MPEIILIRHGETAWNASETFRGRADIDLNETGLKQAELVGQYLSAEKIDKIYASPLKRALQTAEGVARFQQTRVEPCESLIDFSYGEWEGRPLEEVKARWEELYRDWMDTPEQVRMPGGESLNDVKERVMPFVGEAVTQCGEGKVALVSHRVVLKVIICALLGLSNAQFPNVKMDTAAVTRFEYDGVRIVLTCLNDTSHLRALQARALRDF
jgi:broad specificity phosphatase PhoE